MQTLEDKKRGCTPQPKEDLHRKRESKKKIESNKKKRLTEREKKNCQRVFSLAIASPCSYGDKTVEPHLLNKDAISKLEIWR